MSARTIIIIMAAFGGGVAAIAWGMIFAAGGQTPGTYAGISNAAHTVSSPTHCYSFQTGCKHGTTAVPQSQMTNGAYLSANYQSGK